MRSLRLALSDGCVQVLRREKEMTEARFEITETSFDGCVQVLETRERDHVGKV